MADPIPQSPQAPSPQAAPQIVNVIGQDGELRGVYADHLPDVLRSGAYRLATPDETASWWKQKDYGGVGQGIAAFAEGLGSALTFGGVPAAETALGLTTPEAIQGRKDVRPVLHGAGYGIGIAAPLIATAGASAPASAAAGATAGAAEGIQGFTAAARASQALRTAAEFTAPAIIARAGRAAMGAAEGLPGIAGRALPLVAAGATEGALYGGADVTEKALLGDPQLTWEKAATEIGLGGVFGGALAGGTGLAAKGMGALLRKTSESLESIAGRVAKGDPATVKLMLDAKDEIAGLDSAVPGAADSIAASTPETAQFILKNRVRIEKLEGEFPGVTDILSRAEPETGQEILNNWHKLLKDPQARIEVGAAQGEALQSTYSTVEDALRRTNRAVRPEEIARLTAGIDPQVAGAEYSRIFDAVDGLARKMRGAPELYPAMYPAKLEALRDGMVRDVGGITDSASAFRAVDDMKGLVDNLARFGKLAPPEHVDAIAAVKGLRTEIKQSLENAGIWGEAGTRQAAFNAAQNEYLTARKALEKTLMQKVVTQSGAVTYEVAPTKVNSWVNLMADARGQAKSRVFDDYIQSARNLAREMGTSGYADAPAVGRVVESAAAQAQDVRQRAASTQIVKMLQGHEILSSGPAVPMGRALALEAVKKLPGGLGHIIHGITGTISKVREPAIMVGVLSALNRYAQRASNALESAVKAIFEGGPGGAASAEAAKAVTAENFTHVASDLGHYGSNLDRLASDVSAQTGTLQDHAPVTAEAAHAFAARVVAHLGSKLPQGGPRLTLDPPFEPSATELAGYNEHHEIAVEGPIAALWHLAAGTLTPAHLEASAAMYPRLHAEVQALLTEKLASAMAAKKPIPYKLRLGLGQFLGQSLDSSMTPDSILATQAAYAMAPMQEAQAQAAKQPRNVELGMSTRAGSTFQNSAARMDRA